MIQEEHKALGFKWQAGLISDKQLFEYAHDLLIFYFKQTNEHIISFDISDLNEMGDSIIKAS